MEEAKIFRGQFVSMRLHDLEDDTWMLCRTDTGEPLVIGTRAQILVCQFRQKIKFPPAVFRSGTFCSVSTHYTVAALRLPVCPTALLGTPA